MNACELTATITAWDVQRPEIACAISGLIDVIL